MYILTLKNFTHRTNSIPYNKRPFFAHMLQNTHTHAREVYLSTYRSLPPRVLPLII